MLLPSFFGFCITIIRSNSPVIPQKGKCLAQPCIQVGKGWCGRETQFAKVMCPEQSWDRSPLPGPLQVPSNGSFPTNWFYPSLLSSDLPVWDVCGSTGGPSVEVYTSPYGHVWNTQVTQNCELCLIIFNTKNANGKCHLSIRCNRNLVCCDLLRPLST